MKNQKHLLLKLPTRSSKIVIALASLALLWLGRPYFSYIADILRNKDVITAQLEILGLWGPILYLLVLSLQVVTAIIPGHALMLSVGYLYGFGGGLTLNFIGAVGASQLAFLIARRAGQPGLRRLVPASTLQRWQTVADRQGTTFFLICFWFPIIPSNAANYIAGLGSISFRSFFMANLFGRLPGLITVTLLGAYGIELTWPQWALIAALGLGVIVTGRFMAAKLGHG